MISRLQKAAAAAILTLGVSAGATAQDIQFFSIGTGGTAFTYSPYVNLVAP